MPKVTQSVDSGGCIGIRPASWPSRIRIHHKQIAPRRPQRSHEAGRTAWRELPGRTFEEFMASRLEWEARRCQRSSFLARITARHATALSNFPLATEQLSGPTPNGNFGIQGQRSTGQSQCGSQEPTRIMAQVKLRLRDCQHRFIKRVSCMVWMNPDHPSMTR